MSNPFEDELRQRTASDNPFAAEIEARAQAPKKSSDHSAGETALEGGEFGLRGINSGWAGLVTAPYRIPDWIGEQITGGDFLPNIEDTPFWSTYLKHPTPKTDAGRYMKSVGEAIGSSVLPTGALLAKAEKLKALAPTTTPRAIGQQIGAQFAERPGAMTALDAASSATAGLAQEAAREGDMGPAGQLLAGVAGGMAPAAGIVGAQKVGRLAHNVTSPTFARWKANNEAREPVLSKIGIHASAGDETPPSMLGSMDPGSRAAAEQVLANTLLRAGLTVDDAIDPLTGTLRQGLRGRLEEAKRSGRFHSNSEAQDAQVLADIDNALTRLAGSVYRSSPEGANRMRDVIYGRQTGITPRGGSVDDAGIPTRPMLSEVPPKPPMGMIGRVTDALRRALVIEDPKHHGHKGTAYRTEEAIVARAKEDAKQFYDATYTAGKDVDLRPVVDPVLVKWRNVANDPETAAPIAKAIRRAVDLFAPKGRTVSNIKALDNTKQYFDGELDNLFTSPIGRNRRLGGILNDFKKELLAAVDDVKINNLGKSYNEARSAYGSEMQSRDAIKLGRDLFKEDSEIAADAYNALTKGEQTLARLGFYGAYEQWAKKQPRGADLTKPFDTPRMQEILRTIIPRTQTKTGKAKIVKGEEAEFADRPERFGRYLGNVKSEISTRDQVIGGSPTQMRARDDEANDIINDVVENFKNANPSLLNWGLEGTRWALNKVFGYRADTAGALAKMLFTANPAEREAILDAIRARMGETRFELFSRVLAEQKYAAASRASAGAVLTESDSAKAKP